ncbi:polysaccharide biosynthesis/export family protein [Algoriphagus machipongonensis]|nr:polysaccharide biosynthesis/export family protein [Algoriphagus machipongonensis]
MKNQFRHLFLLSMLLLLFSCVSNERIVYMQDLGADSNPLISTGQTIPYQVDEYLLQAFDIVDISVKTTNPEINEIFNVITGDSNGQNMSTGQNGGDVFFMNGYTLDENGVIEMPLIGELNLLGMDTKTAKALIEQQVSKYVNEGEYFVRLRLGGIRFSAIGEFNNPGKQTILQNRANIFEAIATAGDMTILAKRNEVTLLRQYPEGSKLHKINLNDKNLLGTEFFFIRPNDVIYAEPLKVRELGSGTNFIQSLALVTSMVTAIALILSLRN